MDLIYLTCIYLFKSCLVIGQVWSCDKKCQEVLQLCWKVKHC